MNINDLVECVDDGLSRNGAPFPLHKGDKVVIKEIDQWPVDGIIKDHIRFDGSPFFWYSGRFKKIARVSGSELASFGYNQ